MSKKSKKHNKKSKKQIRKENKANFKKLVALAGVTAYGLFLWKMYELSQMFSDMAENAMKKTFADISDKTPNTPKVSN
jgi:hypothetical protein